jgi:pyruvate dehydrogenase E2 component (dihydrolipoamide acetyltransferase)
MATVIKMPRLSDTMTEGTVATWLKKVGDKISEGDILAEIETDKATMEFESFNSGTLLHIGIQEGQSAPVDSLLAIIGKDSEDISSLLSPQAPKAENKTSEEVKTVTSPTTTTTLPKGVIVVTMPRLSDTMTEGTVATWLKKVGDKVVEGDILAEIETDKATMEFESFNAGTLLFVGIQEGQSAPVDNVLAIIGPAGTDITGIAENYKNGTSVKQEATKAVESAVTPNIVQGQQENSSNERVLASPLAKKIAQDKGINISQVKGSGENGRIIKSDIENFKAVSQESRPASQETSSSSSVTPAIVKLFVPAGETFSEEIKNSQMRKIIAKRLSESIFT